MASFGQNARWVRFAEKIWRTYREAGQWHYVVGFGYGDPELPELQTADMIAYEAFQCAREVYEHGQLTSPLIWEKNWPLIKKLQASKKKLLGKMMDEERLIEMLREGDKKRKSKREP